MRLSLMRVRHSKCAATCGHTVLNQFFATNLPSTLTYYKDKLGFDCLGTWQDPPLYAIVARDQHRIHFRCAESPAPNPDKYADELLDAYLFVEDADALFAEYGARGVEFTRGLANTPWDSRAGSEGQVVGLYGRSDSTNG